MFRPFRMILTISNHRILFSLIALSLLEACGSTPQPRETQPVFEEVIIEEPEAPVVLTADDLLQQAADASADRAALLLLQAATLLRDQGNNTEAENVVAF